MTNLADQFVRETKTEVVWKLAGAPVLPDSSAGQAIRPRSIRMVTFSGTKEKPGSARSYVEATGMARSGRLESRTQKWNIMGTSAPDISRAPQWIKLLVGA